MIFLCIFASSKACLPNMYRIAVILGSYCDRVRTDRRSARYEQLTLIAMAGVTIVSGLLLELVISHNADEPLLSGPRHGLLAAQ
jgi:hypothetical protein